jgi:hypothetical protein
MKPTWSRFPVMMLQEWEQAGESAANLSRHPHSFEC